MRPDYQRDKGSRQKGTQRVGQTRARRMYLYWRSLKHDRDYIHGWHKGWYPNRVMCVARKFRLPVREVRDILDAQKGRDGNRS